MLCAMDLAACSHANIRSWLSTLPNRLKVPNREAPFIRALSDGAISLGSTLRLIIKRHFAGYRRLLNSERHALSLTLEKCMRKDWACRRISLKRFCGFVALWKYKLR